MSQMELEQIGCNLSFGGRQLRYKHSSSVLNCEMMFSVFLPPQASEVRVPVLYWLSGLTCTDENFVTKAGAQKYAARHGIAIVCPDTSPRGENVPDDPDGAYDFGLGAGFYVNATIEPWASNYRMYDYVLDELPAVVGRELPISLDNTAISGHSMGGHGAMTLAFNNPGVFKSVSAFSPICSPVRCPWGHKALGQYLGGSADKVPVSWLRHDSVELLKTIKNDVKNSVPVLIDQGEDDNFLNEQLNTQLLIDTARDVDYAMQVRFQPGYDHSYFFIASFIEEHIDFHAKFICK